MPAIIINMKHLICLILSVFILTANHAYAQTLFFHALPNVPIATGITELPDQATIFDKANGRIITVVALVDHDTSSQRILDYYASALPAFGWIAAGEKTYKRESESLTIRLDSYQGEQYMHLTITP